MSRLSQWGLLAACLAGFGTPAVAQAGCCDSGSNYSSGYTPYYAGYTPYVTSYAGYTPYYTGYSGGYGGYTSYYGAPYASGYYPGVGCTSCQPSCGCSPCSGGNCSSGNCGVGCASGNCSTGCATTVNSSGAISPTPDPNSSSNTPSSSPNSIESRLEAIERTLNMSAPRPNARTYEDRFNPRGSSTTIPGRNSNGVNDDSRDFPAPQRTTPNTNTNTNDAEPFQENDSGPAASRGTFRPDLGAPDNDPVKNDTVIPSKKPAPGSGVEDNSTQTLRLDARITSRPVSPRQRRGVAAEAPKPVVAARKSNKTSLRVDAVPDSAQVARY